ncbi:nitroimidazol reductase NimA-like FMN-containing flavoprotein (pyridoxamine 5'-phosphate oxidase superfamily) [Aeromicrobium panaciterrae]|uniref:Nitroimidazol reductase NimA-like FMN-containing flavoprotein (Pyridoxamine 5'-phosphate oxidase superfamily) n=1 Tax=Aeromicrobium panaciterrae TaxID=363861 RepID=A0ABU1UMF4_9ACTN|nr:pyridoxamine 5'-phosphate oxidase family protein [Aeromicrobium panaciterrae]MDR7086369.1 nitroimidazol reductase NimA-like FMN-containing flavoprotein (pyridoxamine 5'-phosphate oxidase superfamily) [Aeromicrobium panaciterrae]
MTTRISSISVLDEQECYQLLSTTTVGRVAFISHHGQQLLPLNFAMVDGVIYFRVNEEGVLSELADGLVDVAFEVDHHGTTTRDAWNVTVRGTTSRVHESAGLASTANLASLRPWAPGERALVVALTPELIDGRRVSSH